VFLEELSSAMNNLSVGNGPAVLDGNISILINTLGSDGMLLIASSVSSKPVQNIVRVSVSYVR
jgi:hypothetical protein